MEHGGLVNEHVNRFVRIEARLSEVEKDMAEVIPWKTRLDADFYNHGRDGLKTQFDKFMAGQEALKEERERQHRENASKLDALNAKLAHKSLAWTIAGVIAAIAGVLISALAIIATVKLAHADIHQWLPITHDVSPAVRASREPGRTDATASTTHY